MDEPDWDRVQVVELLPSIPTSRQQAGILQDAKVLHHAEPGHRQVRLELRERLAISLKEPIEQQPAVWVRQRSEYVVHVGDDM